jgi:hypothetical protein
MRGGDAESRYDAGGGLCAADAFGGQLTFKICDVDAIFGVAVS